MEILRTSRRVVMRDIVDRIVWGACESALGMGGQGGLNLAMGPLGFFLPAARFGT